MAVLNKIKEYSMPEAIDLLVKLAAIGSKKNPDRTLRRMLKLCKIFTRDPLWRTVIQGVEDRLNNNHPAIGVARKFFTQLSPRTRSKLVKLLFVKETFLGPEKRHAVEKELGYYPPSCFVISPSMHCQLRCYGCYAGNYPKDEQLTFQEVNDVVEQAKEIGMNYVIFSGGEPYVWKPLFDIFEAHPDVIFQTFTSGLTFDDGTVDRIIKLGNIFPSISCEGFEKETDERRGKGTFARIIRAMERLRDEGIFFTTSVTVTRGNIDLVTSEEFVDFYIEKGAFVGWYFCYIPIGRDPVLDLMPTPEQRIRLSRRLKHYRSTKPVFFVDFWNDGEHTNGCIAAGRKYFHINNKGDVEPCVFCHFASANIRNTPLKEALKSPLFTAMRARQPYNKDTRLPCILIDNPEVLREVVAETNAYPTHPGAESMITDFAKYLDEYSDEFEKLVREKAPVSTIKPTV